MISRGNSMSSISEDDIGTQVGEWAKKMGFAENVNCEVFKDAVNNPAMKGAWLHLIEHVRPIQEVEHINQVVAEYELSKLGNINEKVHIKKPEDVILYKKQEILKKTLEQNKIREQNIDMEIEVLRKQIEEKKNIVNSIKLATTRKQCKATILKLKQNETKQSLTNIQKTNEEIINLLNNIQCEGTSVEKCSALIKRCLKELSNLDTENVIWNTEFWIDMKKKISAQSPETLIQEILSFSQKLCACIDEVVLNGCQTQSDFDFSRVETAVEDLRNALTQLNEEYQKLMSEKQNGEENSSNLLLNEIAELIKSDDAKQSGNVKEAISQIKIDRIKESIESEILQHRIDYLNNYLNDINTNNNSNNKSENGDDNEKFCNETQGKQTNEKATEEMICLSKKLALQIEEFQKFIQILSDIKLEQKESQNLINESVQQLSNIQHYDFKNKLFQLETLLMQISDEWFSNKIDEFEESPNLLNHVQKSISLYETLKKDNDFPNIQIENSSFTLLKPKTQNLENIVEECYEKFKQLQQTYEKLQRK